MTDHHKEKKAEAIFAATMDLPTAERPAAIAAACGGDAALAAQVEDLLAGARAAEGFLSEATMDAAPVRERPGSVIGRYKLLQQIGEGGFGVVYMADQEKPVKRRVALKVIKAGMDTRAVIARFEAERQALAMMDHPNIARVLDAGATETGRPYFVMELVKGVPITEYCDQSNLDMRQRLELFMEVCRAVQHAHQKGIIHRDLKPSNVMVALHDGKPMVKVIDFGIAKATDQKLTEKTLFTNLGQMIGTPAYMSPEQAVTSGLDVDTRSDIYSLGVLLYELLTGSTPFDPKTLRGAGYDEMRRIIREEQPTKPSTKLSGLTQELQISVAAHRQVSSQVLGRQLQGDLDWIVLKAIEKDRNRRYESASAFAQDIQRHLNSEPVSAGAPGAVYRLQKFIRRNRGPLTGAAVVSALLLAGTVVSTWQAFRATRAESVTRVAQQEAEARRAEAERQKTRAEADEKLAGDRLVQAETSRSQAELSKSQAESAATNANRAAARSDARYLIGEQLLPAAYARAVDAWKLGGKWEDGFTLDRIRTAARQHWAMVAQIPVDGVDQGCIVQTAVQGHTAGHVLVVTAGLDLTTFDAESGRLLEHARLESPATKLFANDKLDSFTVIRADGIDRFALHGLQRVATHALTVPVVTADTSENEALIVDRDGTSRVLALADLSEVAKLEWNSTTTGLVASLKPTLASISPSGERILLHGGPWTEPYTLWSRRGGEPTRVTHPHLRANHYRLIDDEKVLCWFTADRNGGYSTEVAVAQLPSNESAGESRAFSTSVSSDDTKTEFDLQAWPAPDGSANIALIGGSGVATLATDGQNIVKSDRYVNLLPNSDQKPTYLAASFASGLLAVRQPHGVAVFRAMAPDSDTLVKVDDFTAHGCNQGLYWIGNAYRRKPALTLKPFDTTKPERTFSLQWAQGTGATPDLMPWAVCGTPDASTLVVITQESKGFDNTVAAAFGNAHALVYRNPGGLVSAPPAWQLDHAWELNMAPTQTWEPRYAAVDPTGNVLLYVTASGGARRFSLTDGKMLGTLPLGAVTHLSDDGTLAAGKDPTGGTLNVFNIATGQRVVSIPDQGAVTGVCVSADNRQLLAADGTSLRTYALPDGHLLSTVPTSLRPLAVPAGALDRFVAFQADDADSTSGNLVMADSTGKVVTVLARAGTTFCPASFSPDAKAVAMVTQRWHAGVFRSLSPEQLAVALGPHTAPAAALASSVAEPAVQLPPATPTNGAANILDATDAKALEAHLGESVVIRGTVTGVGRNAGKTVAFLDFAGANGAKGLTGFIPTKALRKFAADGADDHLEDLKGHQVLLSGSLLRYVPKSGDPTLEIVINDPSQLKVEGDKP